MAFSRNPLRRLAVLTSPTAHYAGIQSAYWNVILTTTSFSTVFLLEYGVTIKQVGFIIAAINLLAVLVQIVMGNWVSRGGKLTLKAAVISMCVMGAICSFGLLLVLERSQIALAAFFIISAVLYVSLQPLITSMAMEHINRGYALDYSLTRGVGAMAYAIMMFVLGKVIVRYGSGFLPAANIGFVALTIALVVLFRMPTHLAHTPPPAAMVESAMEIKMGFLSFVRKYKSFFTLLSGVVFITICNRVVSTYFIKIIENIGGDSSTLGTASAIAALVEFPVMASFIRLRRKFGGIRLLRLSLIFYTVKLAAIIFATSVWGLYLVSSIQILGYAIFIPAFIFYINQAMEDRDRVRGQSLGVAAMTAGDVLGALLCGLMPAAVPMKMVLYVALAIAGSGSVISIIAVRNTPECKG